MHSYHTKLLANHFDDCFIPISSIHSYSARLSTSNNLFLPEVNSFSGNCYLTLVGPKMWYQLLSSLLPPLPSIGKLRNTSYTKKMHNYVF